MKCQSYESSRTLGLRRTAAVLAVAILIWNNYLIGTCSLTAIRLPLSMSSVWNPVIAEIISNVSESELYNTVFHLQNFKTRVYGHSGNTEAGTYLYDRFSNISGLNVEYQGGSIRNVIATLPGIDETSSAIYIVGAHYDSTSSDPNDAPGATDNGGGVAIVLELARIMSQYRFTHTLKFALWNREEDGFVGSRDYVEYAKTNGLNISLYFNYDSSCYDPENRMILDIMYNADSLWVSEMMTEHNSLYEINFALTYNVHGCGSDHRPFWENGYTAVMTHEEEHGPAHTPDDTIDKVSTAYARKNAQLGMSVLAELAEIVGDYVTPWDITGPTMWVPDGKCDIRDVALAAIRFGTQEGDERYDARADITGPAYLVPDGKIDIRDIALIALHFGETY